MNETRKDKIFLFFCVTDPLTKLNPFPMFFDYLSMLMRRSYSHRNNSNDYLYYQRHKTYLADTRHNNRNQCEHRVIKHVKFTFGLINRRIIKESEKILFLSSKIVDKKCSKPKEDLKVMVH